MWGPLHMGAALVELYDMPAWGVVVEHGAYFIVIFKSNVHSTSHSILSSGVLQHFIVTLFAFEMLI